MSPEATQELPPADAEPAAAPPQRRRGAMFTKRPTKVPLPADAAARQGRLATLAWTALGDGEKARAFLNTHDDALGGRPIDLAIAGDDGLAAVEAAIAALVARNAEQV